MNTLDEIYNAYLEIERCLSKEMGTRKDAASERVSELNQYGIFILLFGQLEDYINKMYEQFVEPWENAAFIHRVNVIFNENSRNLFLINNYYNLRNALAHGHTESGLMFEKMEVIFDYFSDIIGN